MIAGSLEYPPDATVTGGSHAADSQRVADEEWRQALLALNEAEHGRCDCAGEQCGQRPGAEKRRGIRRIRRPGTKFYGEWRDFDIHLDALAERAARLGRLGL